MSTSIGSLFASIGIDAGAIDKDLKDAAKKFAATAKSIEGFGKDLSVKLTAPLAAFGGIAVKQFAEFEKGMAEVGTIAGGTAEDLARFGDGARKLSRELGTDLNDSVRGLYEALSANIPKDNALAFLATASKAGIAGVTSTKVAVDGLSSALNAWKIPAEEATAVSDKFFIAVRNGKSTFEQLAAGIGQVAPTANAFGIGINETLAATATLTKQGVKTSEAFTQIRAAIVAVAKPNKDMASLLASLGYESGSAALKSKGLVGVLTELRDKAGNLDALTEALGSIEALGAATGLTGDNLQTFRGDLADVAGSAGSTEKAFTQMNATSSAAFGRLKASLNDLAVTVGQILVPALLPLVDKLKALADSFASLDAGTQQQIVAWGLFAAALGPVLIVAAKVIGAVGQLITWGRELWALLAGLTTASAILAKVVGFVVAALTSTVTWVVTAGLALGVLLSQFEVFQQAGDMLGQILFGLYEVVSGVLIESFGGFRDMLQECWEGLKEFGRNIKELLSGPLDWISSKIDALTNGLANLAESALTLSGSSYARRDHLPGRASGGPVLPGGSYLVGEHGPEVFTPSVMGRISTGQQVAQAGGGGAPSVVIHLSAGVPEAVRAAITAELPRITGAVAAGLRTAAKGTSPLGSLLRTGAAA